jgi:hypothetical protein
MSSSWTNEGKEGRLLLLELIHTSHGQTRDHPAPPGRPNLCCSLPTSELETIEEDDLPASSDIARGGNHCDRESVES